MNKKVKKVLAILLVILSLLQLMGCSRSDKKANELPPMEAEEAANYGLFWTSWRSLQL